MLAAATAAAVRIVISDAVIGQFTSYVSHSAALSHSLYINIRSLSHSQRLGIYIKHDEIVVKVCSAARKLLAFQNIFEVV